MTLVSTMKKLGDYTILIFKSSSQRTKLTKMSFTFKALHLFLGLVFIQFFSNFGFEFQVFLQSKKHLDAFTDFLNIFRSVHQIISHREAFRRHFGEIWIDFTNFFFFLSFLFLYLVFVLLPREKVEKIPPVECMGTHLYCFFSYIFCFLLFFSVGYFFCYKKIIIHSNSSICLKLRDFLPLFINFSSKCVCSVRK